LAKQFPEAFKNDLGLNEPLKFGSPNPHQHELLEEIESHHLRLEELEGHA
jgi:hypothetical protein